MSDKTVVGEFPWRCRHGHLFRARPVGSVCPVCNGTREHDDATAAAEQRPYPRLDWYKLLAILMFKLNIKETIFDEALITRFEQAFTPEDQATILVHAKDVGLVLKLMPESEAVKTVEEAVRNGAHLGR